MIYNPFTQQPTYNPFDYATEENCVVVDEDEAHDINFFKYYGDMKGIDYYPMDVDFLDDPKLGYIEAKFGADGLLVVLRLWQVIYRDKGYYCDWNDDECLLFARRYVHGMIPVMVQQVVDEALARDLFSKKMYDEFGILTSRKIQEVFSSVTKRRIKYTISEEHCLLKNVCRNGKNASKNEENVYNSSDEGDEDEKEDVNMLYTEKEKMYAEKANLRTELQKMYTSHKKEKNQKKKESKVNNSLSLSPSKEPEAESEEREREGADEKRFLLRKLIKAEGLTMGEEDQLLWLTNDGDGTTGSGKWLMDHYFAPSEEEKQKLTIYQLLDALQRWHGNGSLKTRWTWEEWQTKRYLERLPKPKGQQILDIIDERPELIAVCVEARRAIEKSQHTKNPVLLPGEFILKRLQN